MYRHTVENSRHERGMYQPCRSTDAHREHIHGVESTDWYCPGILGNLLDKLERIESLLSGETND